VVSCHELAEINVRSPGVGWEWARTGGSTSCGIDWLGDWAGVLASRFCRGDSSRFGGSLGDLAKGGGLGRRIC